MQWSRALSVAVLAACARASLAQPIIYFYPDRESYMRDWGNSPDRADFEDFTEDTPFRSAPVRTRAFRTLQQQGPGDFRNEIDVVPLRFPDEGATTNVASLFTNADGPTEVVMTFNGELMAFGMDTFSAADGEGVRMFIMHWGTTLGTVDLPGGTNGFVGFYLPGHLTTHVIFRSIGTIPGSEGEGFSIDNMVVVPFIPAPGPLALLGLAAAWCVRRPGRRLRVGA